MIVPMKKVCLVVQDSICDIALNKLRDTGVVHLERKDITVDINSCAQKRKVKVDDAIGLIRDLKIKKEKPKKKKKPEPEDNRPLHERRQKPIGLHRGRRATDIYGTEEEEPFSLSAVRAPARPDLSDYMLVIDKERKILKERDFFLTNEIKRLESWGDFDPEIIHQMESFGMPVYLYELYSDDYANLDKDVTYIKVKSSKNIVRIVVFEKEIKGLTPFKIPEKRLSEYIHEEEIVKKEIEEYNEKIKSFVNRRQTLDSELLKALQDIEFENAMASMEKVESQSEAITPSSKISYLTGYVPVQNVELVKEAAKENMWGLSLFDPEEIDDKVPTKLKNNKVVNLLEPVTGFLGLVPGYHEVDISPWFLTFFCIFFGMIFGDAAYGLILFIMAIVFILKAKSAKKPAPQGFQLLLLLGFSNTVWGVLTCSWFGVDVNLVPHFLQDISLGLISTAKTTKAIADKNIQIFCFSLGLIHLSIAHFNNVIRFIKTPRFLAEIGSIFMLAGMYNVVLSLIVSRDIPILPVSLGLIAVGFLLCFIFAGYRESVKQSAISGLKNIIPNITGVINIFGDIMSYIRLWAVGLAGASIAETVNILAGPLLGSFLIFAGIIILVVGHGLNMVLNVLSMLVHGVRLNTLEFSGHVGLTWSGTSYRPFANRDIK